MRKGIKILLIIAAALTLIGGAIFTVGVIAMSGNASFLDESYQNKIYESEDKFDSIVIKTDTTDIELIPYDKDGYKVECFEEKKISHSVTVKDGTLIIERHDTREWYEHISIFSKSTSIKIYVPAGEYSSLSVTSSTGDTTTHKNLTFDSATVTCSTGDVSIYSSTKKSLTITSSTGDVKVDGSNHGNLIIKTTTGDITATNSNFQDVKLSVSSGKTIIKKINCVSFDSNGDTGDISANNLIAQGTVSINRSTGDVTLDKCDAAELYITTDTGDVKGSLLSPKIFLHDTDTGDVSLPDSTTGGKCKITTDTGDISFSIVN